MGHSVQGVERGGQRLLQEPSRELVQQGARFFGGAQQHGGVVGQQRLALRLQSHGTVQRVFQRTGQLGQPSMAHRARATGQRMGQRGPLRL